MDMFNLFFTVLSLMLTKPNSVSSRTRKNDSKLDFSTLNRDQLVAALHQMSRSMYECKNDERHYLKRVYLANRTVTCNDGTSAGYYLRKSSGSNKWIVFLEGGWYCFDQRSCLTRWTNMRHYMTSQHWPKVRKGMGILSWDPAENPYYFHSNMVLIPYCTSDSWSGTIRSPKGKFSFMGSIIIEEVIKELLPHGLSQATKLILAGSSAGGTGVYVNLDRVSDLMAKLAPRVPVRGIADSGWFIDNKQYRDAPCLDAERCSPNEGIRRGMRLWQGRVPEACALVYPSEPWKCYFGYRLYPSLRTPVYVMQFLFDEAQMAVDNVGIPMKKQQWQYIHRTGLQVRDTLRNISAVFAPACFAHVMLINKKWRKMSIGGESLMKSVYCWESQSDRHTSCSVPRRQVRNRKTIRHLLGDDPTTRRQRRKKNKRRERSRRKLRRKRRRKRRKKENAAKKRTRRNSHHGNKSHDTCQHRLIDRCQWPQCNFSCPKLRNPLTNEKMDFVDLVMQFGLDLSSMARALGTDVNTIRNTDHDVLLKMISEKT